MSKRLFVAINLLLGPLVPASYVWSAQRWPEQLGGLWGGIPDAWQTPYTANMPLAALGYLAFTWLFFRHSDEGFAGPLSQGRINLAYVLVLVPSMVWMPLTSYALATGTDWWWTIQLVLAAVAVGSLVLLYGTLTAEHEGRARTIARVGAVFFCLQTVVLDAIVWPRYFG